MPAAVWLAIGLSSASAAAVVNTIPVGNGARGVSSDGAHVWVANWDDGTVSEIDASSGTVVNTIPVGSDPFGVSSDGTHVWVTHWVADGTVSEIDASTGAVVNTIPVGSGPYAVSSDGTHVWVANLYDGTVSEIDASSGRVVNTIPVGTQPESVSSDGTHVWVANETDGTVSEIDASTGTVVNTIPVGSEPTGVSSDGTHVWVANYDADTVSEIDASTGTVVNTITFGYQPYAVSSDGTHVWVTNPNDSEGCADGTVSEIDASTGTVVQTIPVGSCPVGVSSDGIHVWVTNEGDDTVSEIEIGPSAPDIVVRPDAATRSTSATFEFTSDTDGAQFECSLDGSAFSACSSPQTYSGLADGPHTFQVGEHETGQDPGPIASYSWAVYTHPPVVTIDSAPSGTTTSQTATVTFHGTAEDGNNGDISNTCSLDGGAASVCSSPETLNDLSPGAHSLTIVAVDDVGNESAPVTVSWTLGATAPAPGTIPTPSLACPAPLASLARAGLLVTQGVDGTCLKRSGKSSFSATGPVTLDGLTVSPDPGSTLTLTPGKTQSVFSSTGGVAVGIGSLPAFPLKGPIKWTAPVGNSGLLGTGNTPWNPTIGGLHALVNLSALDLSIADGGSVSMTISLQLPSAFNALPGAATGVSADFTLKASNDKGVDFMGQVNVASLYVGTTQVKDLHLSYDLASGTFMGSAMVLLVPDKGPSITMSITIGPSSSESVIGCCIRQFELDVQDINKEIPDTPLFLQTINGSAKPATTPGGISYPVFAGNVALTIGPQTGQAPPAVGFDGGLELDLSPQWSLTATGKATVESFPLANAKVKYTEGGTIELNGDVTVTIHGYGLSAAIVPGTFFQVGGNYNIDATGSVTLGSLGSAEGEAVFSNNGYAACATIDGLVLGWGVPTNGTPEPFAGSCDMGPYEATESSAHAAGAALHFSLGAHHGQRLIAVHGTSAAPQLTLTGPGLSLVGGAGANETPSGLIVPDPTDNTTYVILRRSPAGNYSVTAQNTAITSVSIADSLPPVAVSVHTRSLPDGKRRLTYSQRTAPGQHLELFEQGTPGNDRLLLSTTRARGQLTYTPAVGLGSSRTIRAITIANGLPRATQTLAPYRINDSRPPRVPSLLHHGQRLSWQKTPRAVRYMLAFTTTNGTTPTVTTRARTVRIPDGATAATIVAIDAADRPGPAATIKLPVPAGHPRKPKRADKT